MSKALDLYRNIVQKYPSGFDYQKIEPYLDFFDGIPTENIEREISIFCMNILLYVHAKKENKQLKVTKQENIKYYKALEATIEYLSTIPNDHPEFDTDEIMRFITGQLPILELKIGGYQFFKPNKKDIREHLKNTKKTYNLKNSLAMKQLIDAI